MTLKADDTCETFVYDFHDNIPLAVVFGICFVIGLPIVFVGYRLFRFSIFIQPFSGVSLVTYLLLTNFIVLDDIYIGIISGSTGLFIGCISVFIYPIGYLFANLIQSAFLTTCILYAVNLFVYLKHYYVGSSIFIILWIILFALNLRWKRPICVIESASYGAILVMLAVDFYLDLSVLRLMAYKHTKTEKVFIRPCWFSWTILALWPILVFLGSIVQFLKTARKFDHTTEPCRPICCRKKKEPPVRLLSDKSDVIASAWMGTPSTVRSYKSSRQNVVEDEVFLMEDTTPV